MKKLIILLCLIFIPALTASDTSTYVLAVSGQDAGGMSGNSDDFTGSQAALATHDANWTASADGVANFEIDGSGHLRLTGNYKSASAYYDASTSDVSQVVVPAGSTNGYFRPRVCVRMSDSVRGYCFGLIDNDGTNWGDIAVYKDGGVLCYLEGTYSASSNHTIKIVASGTSTVTLNAYVDGSEVTSGCTDSSSPYESGHPGVMMHGSSAADYANNLMDDWQDYED